MQIFLDLKLRTKMLLGFIVVGFILFFGTAVGVYSTYHYKEEFSGMYTGRMMPALSAADFFSAVQELQDQVFRLAQEPASFASLSPQIKQTRQAALDSLAELKITSPQDLKSQLDGLQLSWDYLDQDASAAILTGPSNQASRSDVLKLQQDWNTLKSVYAAYDHKLTLLAGQQYQASTVNFLWVVIGLAGAGSIGITMAIAIGIFVSGTISKPVKTLAVEMQHLSRGDVRGISQLDQLNQRRDEIGELARDLQNLRAYLVEAASEADAIASGNLQNDGTSQGDQDVLANALNQMVNQLRRLVGQMQSSSNKVNQSAQQFAQTAGQTTQASSQVTLTIEKMAEGITHQTEDMRQTLLALRQTHEAIRQVASSAQKQEGKLGETLHLSSQMDQSIQQMLSLVNSVAKHADHSAEQAQGGAGILHQTLASMQEIQGQVNQLGEKVTVMENHSQKIGEILETIEEIARKTNILAINATIESAHAESQAKHLTEETLGQMMLTQCQLINRILITGGSSMTRVVWKEVCDQSGCDTIMITDGDGVTIQSNEDGLIGWRFPDDPQDQAYTFRQLLKQRDGKLCQESQERSFDHRVFKYVGVSRSDQPGIVQIGLDMKTVKKFDLQIQGFEVVANEVYQLAEHARSSTHEIRNLIQTIQSTIREAQVARQNSQNEVSAGIESAGRARNAFDLISGSVVDVRQLAQQAQQASLQMQRLSGNMVSVFDTFQQVVVENTGATRKMTDSFGTISKAIESAAQLSAQNTNSVQQVLATNDVMRTQMADVVSATDTLNLMASELQETVQRFRVS